MKNRTPQRLRLLQRLTDRLSDRLSDRLDDINDKLAYTVNGLASIQEAYDELPHPAKLEGLADVTDRICGHLAFAKETWDALPDESQVERLAEPFGRCEP